MRNSPTRALEWFPFCANLDLRRNCTLHRNYPSGTSESISFRRQLGSYLGVKIPGYFFLGIPLCFFWCLGINWIPPCFPPLGFTLIVCSRGTTFSPRWGFPILLLSWGTPLSPPVYPGMFIPYWHRKPYSYFLQTTQIFPSWVWGYVKYGGKEEGDGTWLSLVFLAAKPHQKNVP